MTTQEQIDRHFMSLALEACKQGIDHGQSPFGACIVRPDTVEPRPPTGRPSTHGYDLLVAEHNHVWAHTDPTAHAEVCAIRQACSLLAQVHLDGCTIYSTTEPCPMCFTAIHWARIGRIVYAARVEDAIDFGFNELQIPNRSMVELSGSQVQIVPDLLRHDALTLYQYWRDRGGRTY